MELERPMLTYVDWERGDPYTYSTIRGDELETLVFESPQIFFARKFKADTVVEVPGRDGYSLYDYMHDVIGLI